MTASQQSTTFTDRAAAAIADRRLITAIHNATKRHDSGRRKSLSELNDPLAVRQLAAHIKDHTLENLDTYLGRLAETIRANGGHVHFADTNEQARRLVKDIADRCDVKRIVKAKSMTTEEIRLTPFLEEAGFEIVETDLGEFIVQLGDDHPSHLIAPVIHKTKAQIADLFHEKLGIPYTDDPGELTSSARKLLRERFRLADMGIVGCNFAVAENGAVCIVTNEGNGRYCANRPRVVVAVMGMEKVIPRMVDLAVFLKLLARSGSGQRITCYTNLIAGPKAGGEVDGPTEFHLVVLDGGRMRILGSDYRETLRCIRCGACLNTCPVYRNVGGHTYDSVYPGPIGKLVTPLLTDLGRSRDLPQASSLCGACYEACPVRIDIPEMLIRMRNDLRTRGMTPISQRLGMKLWRVGMSAKWLYKIGATFYRLLIDRAAVGGYVSRLPGQLGQWTKHRDMPAMAKRPFHQLWKEIRDEPVSSSAPAASRSSEIRK